MPGMVKCCGILTPVISKLKAYNLFTEIFLFRIILPIRFLLAIFAALKMYK